VPAQRIPLEYTTTTLPPRRRPSALSRGLRPNHIRSSGGTGAILNADGGGTARPSLGSRTADSQASADQAILPKLRLDQPCPARQADPVIGRAGPGAEGARDRTGQDSRGAGPWSVLGPYGIRSRRCSVGTSGHSRHTAIAGHGAFTATTSDDAAAWRRVRAPPPTAAISRHRRRPSPRARWSASCGLNCQSRPSML
jgi:hypothetical protein